MTKLIGLYEDQQKAEKTINALIAANLEGIDIQTLENWENWPDSDVDAVPVASSGYGTGGVPAPALLIPSLGLGEEEEQYFKRSLQNGAILIVVDVSDSEAKTTVKTILRENSVRVTTAL